MLAIATTPYIITSWTGGPISQRILEPGGCGWRWGFGIFAILVFVTTAPLIYIFWRNYKKAIRMGVIERKPWNVTLGRVKNYLVEVDAVGILLLAGGLALFLLPFSLYSYQKDQWASPLIISFLVVGVVLIAAFVLYEKYLAPVTFIPYSLLADRTIFFGGIMFLLVFFNSMVWGSYFFSMLQVVFFQSIPAASNISAIYRVGSCAFAIVAGLAIRWSGRFKWMNLYFAVPLMILGVALMIPFRQPGTSIGLIIMTQIFVACAGGTIVIVGELAMMAPAGHQHIAVIIAILNLFGSVGSAVGGSVATAIWTSVFKKGLQRNLEGLRGLDGNLISWEQVYGSILWQTLYKRGTPARDAINAAYGEAQRIMLIASVVLLVGAWFCVLFWRDIDVKHMKQVRGRVF
jgi:MFS family permease